MVPIVQFFYAYLQDQESRNTNGHIWDTVLVQGKEVQVTAIIICDFYHVPYYENNFIDETSLEYFRDMDMDNITNFVTEGRGKWKYRAEEELSKNEAEGEEEEDDGDDKMTDEEED
ncbi:hypothetical protein J1N35_035286 [Gossypium stocksii]|uniref:Uncharacterized protein n=1 Tax=Gossypium stocksii TaxID=47602 RepID=A0A9D3UU01_9ROSI|nr:hypothetical protein J1N35_035286 [Gossypium stocksii]